MTDKDYIELKPIFENPAYYDLIQKKILKLFTEEFYSPLINLLNENIQSIKNSKITNLEMAIHKNKVYYSNGKFYGKFNSYISKELQELGAKWDNSDKSYKIAWDDLPLTIRGSISISKARFEEKLAEINKKLEEINSQKISEKLKIANIFDRTLFELDKNFRKSVEKITVEPKLADEQREKIAEEWQNNMKLDIKNFTDEQVKKLREKVHENVFSGNRRESLIKMFQESYNVTHNKAKFWAHQETNLLMAKYKETRYVSAGIPDYKWACVKMPHQKSPQAIYIAGEVRYSHGILEGKIFSWNDPPITTPPGQAQRRNNPGQDYNCRCYAIPVLSVKK